MASKLVPRVPLLLGQRSSDASFLPTPPSDGALIGELSCQTSLMSEKLSCHLHYLIHHLLLLRDLFHGHYDNHLLGYLGSAGSFSDFTFKTKALRPSHLLHWYDFFLVVRTKVVGNGKALSLPCWCIPFCWCHCYADFSYKNLNYLEHNKNPPEGSWSEKTGFIYLLAPSAIPTY